MTVELSKKFHGVGIGPLSKILAVKSIDKSGRKYLCIFVDNKSMLDFLKFLYGSIKIEKVRNFPEIKLFCESSLGLTV